MRSKGFLGSVRVFAVAALLPMALAFPKSGLGQAQYTVLYSFCSAANCIDGGAPHGKLIFDKA